MLTRTQEVNTKLWNTITKLRSEQRGKLPPETELCNMYKASRSTVRRAMQQLVENGTLKRVQGKGTFISEQRSEDVVSTGKVPLIGLACDTLKFSDYMIRIVKGVVKAAHEKGLEVMVCSFGGQAMINSWLPTQQGPAEFVGFISPEFSKKTIDVLEKRRIPYVGLLEIRFEEEAKFRVMAKQGLAKCFEYLYGLGHRKISYIEAHNNSFNMGELKRISKEYQQSGRNISISTREGHYLPDQTTEAVDEILANEDSRPTAFVCHDDVVASWVINHLKRKNYSVPQDFSVLGIGNLSVGLCLDPQITTAALSYDELGYEAIDLFTKQLNGETIEKPAREISHRIIERQSCGAPKGVQE